MNEQTPTAGTPGAAVRIRAHHALCAGWGNCHRFGRDVYPLDAEGQVDLHLLEVPAELAHQARMGAWACPERAITVIEGERP